MELTDETRTYYKAVRPDGTDFFSGTVRYDVGSTVTHPAPHRDDASGYLSVSTKVTDCTDMEWPCRLLEVEPVDPWAPIETLPNKLACHELTVVHELDPHLALGPHGVHVASLIERCKTITADEAGRLGAAWRSTSDAAWRAAWFSAWGVVRGTAWAATSTATLEASRAIAKDATWDTARNAARDAALALVVRDLISREPYQILTKPWASVIGPTHPDDLLEN